jgi:hypothetical protein
MQVDFRSGDLSSTPVAALLLETLRQGTTGILKLAQKGGDAKVYLRSGWPVGCQVFQGFKPLSRYLLAEGLIDMETLDRSLAEMARTHANHGEVLMKMGAIQPEALERVLLKQQLDYLALIVRLDTGLYQLELTEELPGWTSGVPMCSAYRTLLIAMEAPAAEVLVRQTLQEIEGCPVVLAADASSMWSQFGWDDAEWKAVAMLMTPIAQDVYLSACGLEQRRASAMLATLRLLGLLEATEPMACGAAEELPAQGEEPSAFALSPEQASLEAATGQGALAGQSPAAAPIPDPQLIAEPVAAFPDPASAAAIADSPGWSALWPSEAQQRPDSSSSALVWTAPSAAPPAAEPEVETQGTRLFGAMDVAPAPQIEAGADTPFSPVSDGALPAGCEPLAPEIPEVRDLPESVLAAADASVHFAVGPAAQREPVDSVQPAELSAISAAGAAQVAAPSVESDPYLTEPPPEPACAIAEMAAAAEPEQQSSAAPPSPDQHIAEALLAAYEGWRSERDPQKLERRLWGIINFSRGL